MNAKQRRVARRAKARPVFLVEALGRTYAVTRKSVALANRVRVTPITVELGGPDAPSRTTPAAAPPR